MANIIRRGIDEKFFRKDLDPVDITEFIFFNYYGILIQWIINNGDYDFSKNFNHFYDVYLLPILGVQDDADK